MDRIHFAAATKDEISLSQFLSLLPAHRSMRVSDIKIAQGEGRARRNVSLRV